VTEDGLKPTTVQFLPYLGGERTPHSNSAIRAGFAGLAHETDATVLTQAVFEGVAFAFRDSLEALKEAGTDISRATAVGGGSRSHAWLTIIANALNIDVDIPADGDFGAALGAARLGICAATGAEPTEICAPPPMAKTISPTADLTAAYQESYEKYTKLGRSVIGAMAW